jgi:hypothetical protein
MTSTISATASPAGYVPSSPEVTSRRRGEAQFREPPGPVAEQHAARAVALELHRNGLVAIGDERHLGHVRKHARHLPDDAARVDDARARLDAGARSLVDEKLLRERIAARVEHLHGGGAGGVLRADVEQRPQPRVLFLDPGVPLCRRRALDELLLEHRVLVRQSALRSEIVRYICKSRARHLEHALHGIQHDRDDLPDVLEIAVARVGEQQRERQQSEERQACERTGPAVEEGGGVDRNGTHRERRVRDDFRPISCAEFDGGGKVVPDPAFPRERTFCANGATRNVRPVSRS